MAESFGTDAERYDRARPAYPEAMVERIVEASFGPDLLDVGIGTGIAARQFRAAGCRVLGVDADPRMAELARRSGFEVEVARFEEWEPRGRTFDAVVAAQAWHWVEPTRGAARAAEALRPGGRWAACWNAFQAPAEIAGAFSDVYRQVKPDLPFNPWGRPSLDAYSEIMAKAADGLRASASFAEPEHWRFEWERPCTRDEFLDQVPTFGGHNRIPPAQLEALLAGMGSVIDDAGGSFTLQYATVVVTAARSGAPPPPTKKC